MNTIVRLPPGPWEGTIVMRCLSSPQCHMMIALTTLRIPMVWKVSLQCVPHRITSFVIEHVLQTSIESRGLGWLLWISLYSFIEDEREVPIKLIYKWISHHLLWGIFSGTFSPVFWNSKLYLFWLISQALTHDRETPQSIWTIVQFQWVGNSRRNCMTCCAFRHILQSAVTEMDF